MKLKKSMNEKEMTRFINYLKARQKELSEKASRSIKENDRQQMLGKHVGYLDVLYDLELKFGIDIDYE